MTTIPNPPTLGDEFTNEITGVKYKYDGIKWVIVAPEHVADDLEAVLNQGNIADKGMLLTDAEDALIALAPDEATLDIASDTEKKNPRIRLTHIDKLNYPDAQAQIELDNNGTRVDFEFFQDIDECHFRFDNEEKLVLNRDGDAEFTGRVKVEPGIEDNEVVTVQQLQVLEEELEDIKPSLERGAWSHSMESISGFTTGKYNLFVKHTEEYCQNKLVECLANTNGDEAAINACNRAWSDCSNTDYSRLDTWEDADEIYINNIDDAGVSHGWDNVEPGEYLEIINEDGTGFALYQVTSEAENSTAFSVFNITYVRGEGAPSGLARFKLFKMTAADPADFVHKAGDSMSGRLSLVPKGNTPAFYIYPSEDVTPTTYCIRQFGQYYTDEETGERKRDTVFYTTSEGYPSIHPDHSPTSVRHLTPKKYVDDTVRTNVDRLYYPARFSWRTYINTSAGPASGEVQFNGSNMVESTEVRINFKSYDGRLDLYDINDSTVIYSGPTNSAMMLNAWYIGSDTDNKWKWKGTANLTKITVYKRSFGYYFKCDIGSYKTFNNNFSNGARYYFTIPGLF